MAREENIEKYARGELSTEEKMAFEKQLASDEKLVEGLAEYRKTELAIRAAARKKLREEVGVTYAEINRQVGRRILLRRVMAVAAGIIFLIAAGIIWMNGNAGKLNPDEQYAQHFEMPAAPSVRSSTEQINPKWQSAIDNYASGSYELAIPVLRELLVDASFDQKENVKLLLGTCLLSIDETSEAIEILEQIGPESTYRQDAEWYRALALLKAEKLDQAKRTFENIAGQERHFKKKESMEILDAW